MKKKEYISPKATLVLLDAEILVEADITVTSPSDLDTMPTKGNSTWEEPEYDDDDGFGW